MTAPETGSMADHDRLAEALAAWQARYRPETFDHLLDCAKRCGIPDEVAYETPMAEVEDWAARRLAAYRAMMERG